MPRIVDHAAFRAELLEKSFALFARRGYAAVTMREIASELSISTGTLYHYFESKEMIFQRMLEHQSLRDVLEAVERLKENETTEQRLAALLEFVTAHEARFQNLIFIVLDYYRYAPSGSPVLGQTVAYYRNSIREHLRLSGEDSAGLVLSVILGMIVHKILDPEIRLEAQTLLVKEMAALREPELIQQAKGGKYV